MVELKMKRADKPEETENESDSDSSTPSANVLGAGSTQDTWKMLFKQKVLNVDSLMNAISQREMEVKEWKAKTKAVQKQKKKEVV